MLEMVESASIIPTQSLTPPKVFWFPPATWEWRLPYSTPYEFENFLYLNRPLVTAYARDCSRGNSADQTTNLKEKANGI
jgi:hypothetical protein